MGDSWIRPLGNQADAIKLVSACGCTRIGESHIYITKKVRSDGRPRWQVIGNINDVAEAQRSCKRELELVVG